MATDAVNIPRFEPRIASPRSLAHPQAAEPERPLPTLRFSLRHLFWLIAIASVTLTALVTLRGPSYAQLAMLLAASVVALHVFSTALGTKLRGCYADDQHISQPPPPTESDVETASLAAATTPSLLSHCGREQRRLPLGIALGAIVGGSCGVIALVATIGEHTTSTSIAVGALSTAVIGAWFAFLGISFCTILRQSWRDAVDTDH